jgi:hypothetical protein
VCCGVLPAFVLSCWRKRSSLVWEKRLFLDVDPRAGKIDELPCPCGVHAGQDCLSQPDSERRPLGWIRNTPWARSRLACEDCAGHFVATLDTQASLQ